MTTTHFHGWNKDVAEDPWIAWVNVGGWHLAPRTARRGAAGVEWPWVVYWVLLPTQATVILPRLNWGQRVEGCFHVTHHRLYIIGYIVWHMVHTFSRFTSIFFASMILVFADSVYMLLSVSLSYLKQDSDSDGRICATVISNNCFSLHICMSAGMCVSVYF